MSEEPAERQDERPGHVISTPGIFVTPSMQTVSENKTAKFTCSDLGYNTAVVTGLITLAFFNCSVWYCQ